MDVVGIHRSCGVCLLVSPSESDVKSMLKRNSLQASTTGVYLQYATSTFGYHSLLGTV